MNRGARLPTLFACLLPLLFSQLLTAQAKRPAPARPPAKPVTPSPAARLMSTLSLREKVAQLIVIPFNGHPMNTRSREYRQFVHLVSQERVGGLILINVSNGRTTSRADPLEVASFLNRMQKLSKVPLVVSGDFERGASMRVDATTVFPHAMAFTAARDPKEARIEGEITAKESRAIGVHWLFFPDADVNNNPDNPIINIRSYGENPTDVSQYVSAFIEGAHSVPSARVLVTAKHFPGHGDTATDTHLNLATIAGDRARLDATEWPPFRAAIASGVDAVMSAHIAVPALDAPSLPATLSPKILGGILRGEMGFKGLIVTDALEMGGIAQSFSAGDASVRALEAGADVLLMPPDPEAAINAVMAAIKAGRISRKRVEDSVLRILAAKIRLGLLSKKLVDIDEIHSVVNAAESVAAAQLISDRSVTLVKNDADFLPLKAPATTAFFLLAEGRTSTEGQAFALELRRRSARSTVIQLDSAMSDADLTAAVEHAAPATHYVVAAFASVVANRGTAALAGGFPQLIQRLVATKKPVALLALGNPYLLRSFPDVAAYLTTFSSVPPAEISAVEALFGEIPVKGKLPVSIPGLAKYGDGIFLPAR